MEEIQKQKTKRTKIEVVIIILFSLIAIYLILTGTISLVVDIIMRGFLFSLTPAYTQMPIEQRILVTLDDTNATLNNINGLLMIMTGFVIIIALEFTYFKKYRETIKN